MAGSARPQSGDSRYNRRSAGTTIAIISQTSSPDQLGKSRAEKRQQRGGQIGENHAERPCREAGAANSRVGHRPSARPSGGCPRCADRGGCCGRDASGRAISGPGASGPCPCAQSSIRAPRIDSMPPAAASACGRTSMHPPAAAAVARSRRLDPGKRVEHLEEEDEGRDQTSFGEALAAQLGHQRGQHVSPRLRPSRPAWPGHRARRRYRRR